MTKNRCTAQTIINYSPRKARLITNSLKGLTLDDAFLQLKFIKKGKTRKFFNLLKLAANNLGISQEEYSSYKIKTFVAEEAQKYYRVVPRARGSAFRIRRRNSRLKIEVIPKN
jgi:large subunit ribosomal protein L22